MKWPDTITIAEARRLQDRLARKVRITHLKNAPLYVAGVDAAFSEDRVFAAACLVRLPERTVIGQTTAVRKLSFPYVPGFLAFREGPAIVAALEQLSRRPDVVLADGQGIAHPRRMGIASWIGVLTGIPSVGCAKSRLVGEHGEPGRKKGSWKNLLLDGDIVGAVLRTKDGVRPLFVSPGHKTNLDDSITITLACTGSYRIPEPVRCADMLSKKMKAKERPS